MGDILEGRVESLRVLRRLALSLWLDDLIGIGERGVSRSFPHHAVSRQV